MFPRARSERLPENICRALCGDRSPSFDLNHWSKKKDDNMITNWLYITGPTVSQFETAGIALVTEAF